MVSKIDPSMIADLDALITERIEAVSGGKVDIGDYVLSPAASKPKFLKCDGGAYSRATYADLFAVIGTAFGAGDGSTTFNVPNASAHFLLTAGSYPGLTERVIGASGGEEAHILLESEMPSHNHTGSTNSAGAHTHTYTRPDGQGSGNIDQGGYAPQTANTSSAGAHSHTLTINDAGGDDAHNNMPPFLVIGNLFIYAGV